MRILHVVNDLDYYVAHRLHVARYLQNNGHVVELASGGVAVASEASRRAVSDIQLHPLDVDRHTFSPRRDLSMVASLRRALDQFRPDVIHTFTIKPNLYAGLLLSWLRLRRMPIPKLVQTFPGLGVVFEPSQRFGGRLRRIAVGLVLRWIDRNVQPTVTFENSYDLRDLQQATGVPSQRAHVVPGAGVPEQFFQPKARSKSLRVLFASRLLRAKGTGIFLDAADMLAGTYPNVEFNFAGPPEPQNPDRFFEDADALTNHRSSANYLGSLPAEEMPGLLASHDVFCMLSSLREGLPRVVLEAMASGCICIVSNQRSLDGIVVDGDTGIVLDRISGQSLAEVLRGILEDPVNRLEISHNAIDHVRSLPVSERQVAEAFEAIYLRSRASKRPQSNS